MSKVNEELESDLEDLSDGKAIVFRNPDYSSALIGIGYQNTNEGSKHYAVYDHDLMIEELVREDNMTYENAIDFISYNTLGVGGDNFPIILYPNIYKKWQINYNRSENMPLVLDKSISTMLI